MARQKLRDSFVQGGALLGVGCCCGQADPMLHKGDVRYLRRPKLLRSSFEAVTYSVERKRTVVIGSVVKNSAAPLNR